MTKSSYQCITKYRNRHILIFKKKLWEKKIELARCAPWNTMCRMESICARQTWRFGVVDDGLFSALSHFCWWCCCLKLFSIRRISSECERQDSLSRKGFSWNSTEYPQRCTLKRARLCCWKSFLTTEIPAVTSLQLTDFCANKVG